MAQPISLIDDTQQVESLLNKMEAHLPIPAEIQRAGGELLAVTGIMCAISPKDSKEPVVISITHLKIPYRHPLEKEIRAYQKTRTKKLKEQNN